jgi:hypothetical protein
MKKLTFLLTAIPLVLAASVQAQSWGFTLGNGAGFYFGNGGGNQRCNNRPAYVAPARTYYNPPVVCQQRPVYIQPCQPARCQPQAYYPAPVYYAPSQRQGIYSHQRHNHSGSQRGYSNLW